MAVPRLMNPVLDADDVRVLAEFYRQLLDLRYRDGDPEDDWATLLYPDGSRCLSIQHTDDLQPTTWPEPGVPQQMHLDLSVPSKQVLDEEHERVTSLGARLRLDRSDHPQEPLRAYADPAGHIFCLLVG